MNQLIFPEDIVCVIRSFVNINKGDDATCDIIIAIGAEMLDISHDKMSEMLGNDTGGIEIYE